VRDCHSKRLLLIRQELEDLVCANFVSSLKVIFSSRRKSRYLIVLAGLILVLFMVRYLFLSRTVLIPDG